MPSLQFEINGDDPRGLVIAIAGDLDLAAAPELVACLLANTDRDVTLDLGGVTFLDSSGINALIHGYHAFRDAGHTLRTTGEREHVLKVLQLTGITTMLHGDQPDAAT